MVFKTQKHAIIGMGKTGLSIAHFLMQQGTACEAFDEKLKALPDSLTIPLHTGKLQAQALAEFDHIWASPGIPWSHPALQASRDAGIPTQGDLDLFLEHCQAPLIAITGTNGKTTTTQTIQTLLETLPGGCDMGGNIGTPMLDLLDETASPKRVVLELSSFQLERCETVRPQCAILLNIQPDHADMHASEDDYLAAKLKLFAHQADGDTAILPIENRWDDLVADLNHRGVHVQRFGQLQHDDSRINDMTTGIILEGQQTRIIWHQDSDVHHIHCHNIPARGLHQHINLAIAAQTAANYGVHTSVIREALSSFRGLAHRLRFIGSIKGHDWFDDSKATNPAAAQAALQSFDKVLWICGGLPKGLDLNPLLDDIRHHVEHAFIIGVDTKPYVQLMKNAGIAYTIAKTVERAVVMAANHISNLPVLLSPASASMDQFANYAERGFAFSKAAQKLEASQ